MTATLMTSEQKLLQLIRKSSKDRKALDTAPILPPDTVQKNIPGESLWSWVNRILIGLVAVMAMILVWRYTSLQQQAGVVLPDVSQGAQEDLPSLARQERSFEEVRDIFVSRNVFQMSAQEMPPEPVQQEEIAPMIPRIDLSQQYRVVGIALGEQPTAIVENIQNASTVFLGVGDTLDQAVVKEIHKDKVILELNGQMVELKS